jgi:hypothetical protein
MMQDVERSNYEQVKSINYRYKSFDKIISSKSANQINTTAHARRSNKRERNEDSPLDDDVLNVNLSDTSLHP